MNKEDIQRVLQNSDYQELITTRNAYAIKLSIIMLTIYISFILLIAFAPEVLGAKLAEGSVLTVGIPVGLGVILFAIAITGVYTARANREFDTLIARVKSSLREQDNE